MKKNFLKCLFLGVLSTTILSSCSQDEITKETAQASSEQVFTLKEMINNTKNHPILDDSQAKLLEAISKEVILLSENRNFNELIFSQTLKQVSGDYDVELSTIQINSKTSSEIYSDLTRLSELSLEYEKLSNGIKLKLYYPRAATLEKQMNSSSFENKAQLQNSEVVIMNNFNADYSSPAYTLDENENLVFSKNVTEDYANYNNIYVIGSESMSTNNINFELPDDPYAGGGGGGGGSNYVYRSAGRAEYGGKIQVTDMNAIEHWTAGKFEFRVIVVSATGTIIKEKEFPKRARDNFKDKKWYDFNDFYYNWYQSNIGAFTIEKWIEIDDPVFGSGDTEVTITVPPAYEGGPTTTIKSTKQKADDDLGQSIVQYPDRVGQMYGISHMNFKRK
jgi:hypothetical protein|tara:strand:+ start:709 stop:1881 length:1173 start_codon:yes stop_codon:yes gene_type:complete